MSTTTICPAETSEYLDGPGLVAWINEQEGGQLYNAEVRLGFHARRYRKWREGVRADITTADQILLKLGLHLGMVPDELYVAAAPTKRETTEAEREQIERIYFTEGRSVADAVREVGCTENAVRAHIRRFEKELRSAA